MLKSDVKFASFHRVTDRLDGRFFRGRVPDGINSNALLLGEVVPAGILTLERSEGRALDDVVWTDDVAVVLMSPRLIDGFRAQSFSGWRTYPAHVEANAKGHEYLGLSITGRSGPIDHDRGEWVNRDDEPGRFRFGLFFDVQSWDGSDFFIPHDTLYICITQRVRDYLEAASVKNITCERFADVLTSELVIEHSRRRRRTTHDRQL